MIRAAAVEEIPVVLELWRAAGALPSTTDGPGALAELIELDRAALLVAELDGTVVGSLIAAWDGWRGNMYRLAVDPLYRRRGIALQLIQAGEVRLRTHGARRITALVVGEDPEAVAVWRAAGYDHDERMTRSVKTL